MNGPDYNLCLPPVLRSTTAAEDGCRGLPRLRDWVVRRQHKSKAMNTNIKRCAEILTFTALLFCAHARAAESPASNEWTHAFLNLSNRLGKANPTMHYAEYRSPLLARYLPHLRLYASYDAHRAHVDRIYFLDQQGNVTNLPEDWQGNEREGCWRIREITDFVRQQNIRVTNAQAAVEFAQLMEDIQGAAGRLWMLWANTKHFTVFDWALLEKFHGTKTHWTYTPSPRTNGWSVKVAYVGPPGHVPAPPTYEIDLDDEQRFQDLRRYTDLDPWRFPRKP
jgi:hypothetical protein